MALVALTLFQRGVSVTEATVGQLVATLQRNAAALHKSSKFAKLVMELCKSPHYRPLVSSLYYSYKLSSVA